MPDLQINTNQELLQGLQQIANSLQAVAQRSELTLEKARDLNLAMTDAQHALKVEQEVKAIATVAAEPVLKQVQDLLDTLKDARSRLQEDQAQLQQAAGKNVKLVEQAQEESLKLIAEATAKFERRSEEAESKLARFSWIGAGADLLKYPVLLAAIIMVVKWVGVPIQEIPWKNMVSIGADGLKFQEVGPGLVTKLNEAQKEIDLLRAEFDALAQERANIGKQLSADEKGKLEQARQKAEEARQQLTEDVIPDDAAKLVSGKDREQSPSLDGKTGFIWIGNQDKMGTWGRLQLTANDEAVPCNQVESDREYKVRGNMVLRKEEPMSGERYFRGIPVIGVLPSGTRVVAQEQPKSFNRGFATQYWLKVKVVGGP